MIRRPKPGETEEDLLAFQQQFLAEKSKPSAVAVSSKAGDKRKTDGKLPEKINQQEKDIVTLDASQSTNTDPTPPVKKSRFQQAQEKKEKKSGMPSYIEDPNDIVDEHDTHMATVLTKIIERDTRRAEFNLPAPMSAPFPVVQPVGSLPKECSTGKKKKSLFARQFEKSPKSFGVTQVKGEQLKQPVVQDDNADLPQRPAPAVIDGSGLSATFAQSEAQKIHEENMTQLSNMSSDEIFSEQQKLLEAIDPKLVEFLRARKNQMKNKQEDPGGSDRSMDFANVTKKKSAKEEKKGADLPIKIKKEWVNMDKVEYEKLDWMKDLPPPSADNTKTGKQARFDFKGNLILDDSSIPVNVGLHHHGDEPERAGYSLEEIFQLARSSNNQQRCLALQTLGRVIQQAKEGNLTQLIQTPILPSILDAGVVFLLRWSLDDSVDSVVIATIAALNVLLVNQADELVLEKVFHWHQGHRSVCQAPAEHETLGIKLPDVLDEKPQETDADIVKKDVIAALVDRMNFIPRLMYILEKVRPQAPSVIAVLQILIRVTRHSTRLAYQVYNYKGLMDLIVKEFLPLSWTLDDPTLPITNVYGLPVTSAVHLLRTICQAGRNMAAALLSRYQLEETLLRFLATDMQSLNLPETEALHIQIECWNIWKILLSYGLADKLYLELYPSLVQQLRTSHAEQEKGSHYQTRLSAILGALEMAVCVATGHGTMAGFKHSQDGTSMEVERSEEVAMPTLQWSHVADLIQPIRLLLTTLLSDMAANYQIKKQNLLVTTACLNFVRTYYNRCQTEVSGSDMIKLLVEMEEIFQELTRHWQSFGFSIIREALCKYSNLLLPAEEKNVEVSPSVPELGNSSVEEERFLPVVRAHSPYGFMVSLLSLVYQFVKIHKGLLPKEREGFMLLSAILQDSDIWTYLRKVGSAKQSHLVGNWTTRFETHLQYYLLKLATAQVIEPDALSLDRSVLHCVCLQLVTTLQSGDEHLIHDLLSTVLFSPISWKQSSEESTVEKLESMNLADISETYLKSATEQEIRFTQDQLCDEVRRNMSSIRATYLTSLAHNEAQTLASRHHYLQNTVATETCFTSNIGECLLPLDWMFLPLIELYSHFSVIASESQNMFSTSQINNIRNVLRWIYILEIQHPMLLDRVSVTIKLSRIMCTFLTGNDIFLDRTVYCYLAGLLRHYSQPTLLAKIDFKENIPGLPSFYDLYMSMLQQFEAVSFGDALFGSYLCIPLQQRHELQYRRAIWTEYSGILRTLSLPVSQLLVPIQGYLEPEETNIELLRRYFKALYSGALRHCWCPVLYLVAIHHVNRFMFTQDGSHKQLKTSIMQQTLLCKNQELKQHLLYYKTANTSAKFGMELYPDLPAIRKKYVDLFTAS